MNYFVSYRLLFPAVKTFRLILCFALMVFCALQVQAQDDEPVADSVTPDIVLPDIEYHDDKLERSTTTRAEFRQVPDSTIQGLKNRKEFSYANDPNFWKPEPPVERSGKKGFWEHFYDFFSIDGVRMIAYFILIAFFIFIIYRIIVVNKLYLFYNSKKVKVTDEGEVTDLQDLNLDEKIQQALAAGDHRMAVR